MSSISLNIIVISIYLLLILYLSTKQKSKIKNFNNYISIKNDQKISKALIIATIFVTSVGGGTIFGIAEKAFLEDISYTYGLILTIPIDLIIARYIVPKIKKHSRAQSIGDIMQKYYGTAGRIVSGTTSIIVSLGFLAAQISVSAYIFQYILNINYIKGVIISYTLIIVYTTIGGMRSILATNFIQFFAIIIAIPLIAIFGFKNIGFFHFFDLLPKEKIYPIYQNIINYNLSIKILTAFLSFSVMNLYPNFIQRILISQNISLTQKAIYTKSTIYCIFLIIITINGLIGHILYPFEESYLIIPHIINEIIPFEFKGIIIVGMLAAVMSTADSDLNITTISLIRDIIIPIFNIDNQKLLLLMARTSNILIGMFAIILSLYFSNVIDLIIFITGFWGPIILIPFIFGLFNITIKNTMFIITSSASTIIVILWEVFMAKKFYYLHGVFVGTFFNFLTFIIVYLVERLSKRLKGIKIN